MVQIPFYLQLYKRAKLVTNITQPRKCTDKVAVLLDGCHLVWWVRTYILEKPAGGFVLTLWRSPLPPSSCVLLSRWSWQVPRYFSLHTVAEHFLYSCLLGLLVSVTDGLSKYGHEPLAIDRRGCTGRDLNEETLVADNGR